MSARSRAAYYSQIERVYSICQMCGTSGARLAKDGKTLCKPCRQSQKPLTLAQAAQAVIEQVECFCADNVAVSEPCPMHALTEAVKKQKG